jgi:hypothetical protein
MEKYYKISEKLLMELMTDSFKLCALESGGVDNWEWYGMSCCDFLDGAGVDGFDELVEIEIKELELEEVE